jgi:hypothetical protein
LEGLHEDVLVVHIPNFQVLYNITDAKNCYEINYINDPNDLYYLKWFVSTGFPMLSRGDVSDDDLFTQKHRIVMNAQETLYFEK